jgi:hypothetical protein
MHVLWLVESLNSQSQIVVILNLLIKLDKISNSEILE